jgi:hypothetical protein
MTPQSVGAKDLIRVPDLGRFAGHCMHNIVENLDR